MTVSLSAIVFTPVYSDMPDISDKRNWAFAKAIGPAYLTSMVTNRPFYFEFACSQPYLAIFTNGPIHSLISMKMINGYHKNTEHNMHGINDKSNGAHLQRMTNVPTKQPMLPNRPNLLKRFFT